MARDELNCPICTADVPLSGDEEAGQQVFCTYCSAPLKLSSAPSDDDCELEEEE